MLKTSIPGNLTGSLCDTLTGRDDRKRRRREDILPVALDDNRVWCRYHHLFADFVRENLEREGSEPLAPLRLRACERCEDYGLVAEAL